jgi:hypothetical protein
MSVLGVTAAQAGTVDVAANRSIWLAGQPAGVSVTGYFGTDTAPAQSPVMLTLTGSTVTFSAAGTYSVAPGLCTDTSAAGGCYADESMWSLSPWGDVYKGPDALVGIFLSGTPTIGPASGYQGPLNYVAGPDYTNSANIGPGTYSPALNQIFYIGTGTGESFTVPTGATGLYLAVLDSTGGSQNNTGFLTVSFTGAQAVPEPATWAMLLLGLGGLGAVLRMSRRQRGGALVAA